MPERLSCQGRSLFVLATSPACIQRNQLVVIHPTLGMLYMTCWRQLQLGLQLVTVMLKITHFSLTQISSSRPPTSRCGFVATSHWVTDCGLTLLVCWAAHHSNNVDITKRMMFPSSIMRAKVQIFGYAN